MAVPTDSPGTAHALRSSKPTKTQTTTTAPPMVIDSSTRAPTVRHTSRRRYQQGYNGGFRLNRLLTSDSSAAPGRALKSAFAATTFRHRFWAEKIQLFPLALRRTLPYPIPCGIGDSPLSWGTRAISMAVQSGDGPWPCTEFCYLSYQTCCPTSHNLLFIFDMRPTSLVRVPPVGQPKIWIITEQIGVARPSCCLRIDFFPDRGL